MVDHLVFYVIHPYMIYCSGSPLCGTLFCKPAPKFIYTIREGSIHLISVINSKRQSYQCLQNPNSQSSCKVSTFFHFVSFSDDPFPVSTFYWCMLWLLWRHTNPTAANIPVCCLWIKLSWKCTYVCMYAWEGNQTISLFMPP